MGNSGRKFLCSRLWQNEVRRRVLTVIGGSLLLVAPGLRSQGVLETGASGAAAAGKSDFVPDAKQPNEARRVLQPVHATLVAEARAIWIDGARLRWPGPSEGRFRLHHSARGTLRRDESGRVVGADEVVELSLA